MKSVSRFEANLVRVLRGLLQQAPRDQMSALLTRPKARPPCLSRDAVALIEDTLAKGCVHFLARRGYRRERFLRGGAAVEGRLWERTPPGGLGLTFSRHTLEFLLQLVSATLGKSVPRIEELTIGDRIFLGLALDGLRHTNHAEEVAKHWTPLRQDGLCRLLFPEELADGKQPFAIDWPTWTTGPGAALLEAMQGWLADRWVELERRKGKYETAARMRKVGAAQERVYGEYLDALERTQRRDLARCFLDAARRLLHEQPNSRQWIGSLDVSKDRLADRHRVYRQALAFVRQMERFETWQQQALAIGYFDEGYHAGQLWKADWERFGGEQLCRQASAIVREIEPV